jgi:long-chain fatty acid transport protein
VTVYGNGGLNTNYPTGTISRASACGAFNPNPIGAYNILCGNGNVGVDLTQLVVAPTLSYKLTENHALGIAPLIAAQRFEAKGLQAFQGFSTDPRNFTNNGHEITWGGGVRVGYQGRLTDTFAVGAAYSSPIWMQKFKDYQGLFAQQGGFDIPQNFSLGFKWEAVPQFTIGLDYAYIDYSSINSVNNPSSLLGACFGGDPGACLGGGNGAGFGWKSVNVAKLGFEYQATPTLLLRAGYNYTDNPIQPQDVTINILAPGVVQNHLTLGLTWQVLQNGELTIAYMHAFSNSVTGTSLFTGFGAPPTTTETIKMYENSFGIAYGWKL